MYTNSVTKFAFATKTGIWEELPNAITGQDNESVIRTQIKFEYF